MEPVVKLENCDDIEFQSISIEETQLTEVNLPKETGLITRNNLKRSYNTMIDDTSIKIEVTNSGTLAPEEAKKLLKEKESNINDSELSDSNIIYSPPFFKIIHQLGPNKDTYIVRCYSCGRLMRTLAKSPSILINHMKGFHEEITKIYEKYKQDKLQQSSSPNGIGITNAETSDNFSIAEVNTNCSKVNNNPSEAVQTSKNTENSVIEIMDEDDDERTVNKEPMSSKSISISSNDKNSAEFSASALKKLGNIINQRLQKFVKDTGFKELNNKVEELLKTSTKSDSSNPSVMKELQSEVNNLKNECKALRLAVLQTQASKRQLHNELQKMENYIQQRKLIIKNIKITNRQQPIKDIEQLFKDSLSLDNISIVKCFIIPGSKKLDSTNTETESVAVELLQTEDCKLVLRQMHKLKNAGIFIEPELTPLQRKRKNKLMILRKELLSHKPDLKILIRNTTLVVNGKSFYWDDIEGLYHNEADAIELTGVEYLNSLTGLDFKEFINFLLHYEINVKKN